ncbi:YhfC family intramembrane metalloprotease [Candidatus Woesearchaeota archaeon]|nr:YhfC family intramembrane metalloprotease [Candidatus Woesearchaeota archaeon]
MATASLLSYAGRLGMGGVAVVAAIGVMAVSGSSALPFLALGALAWLVAVGLKLAWSVPTNKPVMDFLEKNFPRALSGPASWAYIGFLTGIFECGIVLLFVLLQPMLRAASWPEALVFGVGFGATEAWVLGLFSLSQAAEEKQKKVSEFILTATAPVIERIFALFVHAFTTVLIVLAVQQSSYLLFWFSFGFKSLLDSIAAFGHLKWKVLPSRIWLMELIVAVFGTISLLGLLLLYGIYA